MNIVDTWETEKAKYKDRYLDYVQRWNATHNEEDHGYARECAYVLQTIFGFTESQLEELQPSNSNSPVDACIIQSDLAVTKKFAATLLYEIDHLRPIKVDLSNGVGTHEVTTLRKDVVMDVIRDVYKENLHDTVENLKENGV